MKNYVREGQKLPLYGIGPYLVFCMGLIIAAGMLMSGNVLASGIAHGPCKWLFYSLGILMILLGAVVWYISAFRSGMDDSIADNQLKTDGIYAWVRNPMYSGWWFCMIGVSLLFHNFWLLVLIPLTWGIMTIVLKNTEEKWLLKLYGQPYADYCKKVNRCIPWKRRG